MVVTMSVFHGKREEENREVVGTKTCGSTFSSACARNFIAYFAKSALLSYGDWAGRKGLAIAVKATIALKDFVRFVSISVFWFYPVQTNMQARFIIPFLARSIPKSPN